MPTPCTVTGTLNQLSGGLIGQGKILFQLTNIGTGNPIGVTSTSIIPQLTYSILTAQNGTFTVSLWGNDNINPANTLYSVTFFDTFGNSMGPVLYSITGASLNLNTAIAVSTTSPPVLIGGPAIVGVPLAPQTITGQPLTLTSSAPLNVASTATFSGNLLVKTLESVAYVDQANSQGWAGADYGAWVMSAIASFPTVNGYKAGKVILAPSTSVVTQSSGVTITSPFVSVIGPGPGALQINCTFNGNCWDVHVNPFNIWPGAILKGFSVIGQGTGNANAVGFHIGDVVGGRFEDLAADNFRGTNSAGFWFDNILGFTERNTFNALHGGLAQGGQNGCTKDFRWTNTGNIAATSSFAHNHYIACKYSVLAGQIALSVEAGNHSDTDWFFTGNSATGTTSTVFALSGLTFGAGTPAIVEATNLNISAECTAPCTAGTLLNLAATNNILIHSGGGFFDTSGLLASTIAGNLIRYANSNMNASSARETLRFSTMPGAGAALQYDVAIQHPAAARAINWNDPLATAAFPWEIASGTSTLTANAALAAVTSQAAITTLAANALTTDAIEWAFASAPTAGDNLCHVLPYVTAGNVNFVRTNPTAAAQNVSALVINWKVIR